MASFIAPVRRFFANTYNGVSRTSKIMMIFQPLWGISYGLYIPYMTLYMMALGLSTVQVGLINTISTMSQIVFLFVGPYLSDKIGRKKTNTLCDAVGWAAAAAMWAIAQNFTFFVLAALVNAFNRGSSAAWGCLIVEDTPPQHRIQVYRTFSLINISAGFFAPIAKVMVDNMGLVPAVRILFLFAAVAVTVMQIGRYRLVDESAIGKERIAAMKNVSFIGYFRTMPELLMRTLRNPYLMAVLIAKALNLVQAGVRDSFLSVHATAGLGLPQSIMSDIALVNSIVMLVVLFFAPPLIHKLRDDVALLSGMGLSMVGIFVIMMAPCGSAAVVMVGVVLSAVGAGMANPFIDMLCTNAMPDKDRAMLNALSSALFMVISAPSQFLAGVLSENAPHLPLVMMLVIMTAAIAVMAVTMASQRKKNA